MPRTTSPSANSRGPRGLAAAEREQLPRQPGAALDRLLDLGRFVARRIVGRQLHQQQVGRAHDAHQDVVEVVRDAAGEPADRFELLRLAQLFLERAPLGDVADEAGEDRAAVAPMRATVNSTGNSLPSARRPRQLELAAGERRRARSVMYSLSASELLSPDRPAAAAARRSGRGCRVRA